MLRESISSCKHHNIMTFEVVLAKASLQMCTWTSPVLVLIPLKEFLFQQIKSKILILCKFGVLGEIAGRRFFNVRCFVHITRFLLPVLVERKL